MEVTVGPYLGNVIGLSLNDLAHHPTIKVFYQAIAFQQSLNHFSESFCGEKLAQWSKEFILYCLLCSYLGSSQSTWQRKTPGYPTTINKQINKNNFILFSTQFPNLTWTQSLFVCVISINILETLIPCFGKSTKDFSLEYKLHWKRAFCFPCLLLSIHFLE